eukprot:jgi/Mesvir1/5992/Mv00741-RA.1
MSEIQLIVDKLNAPPFDYNLTLVHFSSKSALELRQLLNDVFAKVDPQQAKDIRDEPPDVTTYRMLDFLKTLKYRPTFDAVTFRKGVHSGTPDVIYPILAWLLPQTTMLQKRAYLSRYLVDVDIPEEMFADEDVLALHEEVKALQEEFKEVHKQVDSVRKVGKNPAEVKSQIVEKENEREQLSAKIAKTKAKLASTPSFDAMLAAAQQLRKQHEEEAKLKEQLREQKAALEHAELRHTRAVARLRDIRASASDSSASALLQHLADETGLNRYAVTEKLPKEIEKKRTRMQAMERVLNDPVHTESDLNALQKELMVVQSEVSEMQEKQDVLRLQQGNKGDMLRQQMQMASMVSRKKEQVFATLDALAEKKRLLLRELEDKNIQVDDQKDKMLKGEDFKRYAASLRGKSQTYTKLKKELADLRTEYGVLVRTEGILSEQAAQLTERVGDIEKKRGVAGFSETQNELEKVSAVKAEIDIDKGATLEEISRYVAEINSKIKERKNSLAPQIKELRTTRERYQEVEAEHTAKKKAYDEVLVTIDGKKSKLEEEFNGYRSTCLAEESRYHLLSCQLSVVDADIKRGEPLLCMFSWPWLSGFQPHVVNTL